MALLTRTGNVWNRVTGSNTFAANCENCCEGEDTGPVPTSCGCSSGDWQDLYDETITECGDLARCYGITDYVDGDIKTDCFSPPCWSFPSASGGAWDGKFEPYVGNPCWWRQNGAVDVDVKRFTGNISLLLTTQFYSPFAQCWAVDSPGNCFRYEKLVGATPAGTYSSVFSCAGSVSSLVVAALDPGDCP